ncbi:hypothetical protein ACFYOT_42925 [Saccharothrix saharensis]|uniref:hypothetical protein n=1 Tax=Saccharothrix saharensis TaxID=571190 RepID=UPI0036CD5EF6
MAYSEALTTAVERVQSELHYKSTSRLKTTGTIIDKLHRFGGSNLKHIQDLAGMRITDDFNLRKQDKIARELERIFPGSPPAKLIDRRADPRNGYRALHVVIHVDRIPVGIQVRTRWQHDWADLYEKFADKFGRGIRYGQLPIESKVIVFR